MASSRFDRSPFRRMSALLLALTLLVTAVAPAGATASAPGGNLVVPHKAAVAIFSGLDRLLTASAARFSSAKGHRFEITSRMLDGRNHLFFAFRGETVVPWHERLGSPTWKIESNGRLALDLCLEHAKTSGDRGTFRFEGDLLIDLDGAVLDLARFATEMAASYALDYVAKNLIDLLARIDPNSLADASYQAIHDLATISLAKSADHVARRALEYQSSHPLFKDLAANIRNGNAFSIFLFNILAVGVKKGVTLGGQTLGALVGSAVAPGAGTIVGGLAGRAGTLLVTHFIINKIGIEWYLKLQLERFVRLAGRMEPGTSDAARFAALERKISDKITDDAKVSDYKKFDVLVNFIRTEKAGARPLQGIVEDLRHLLSSAIMNRNDLAAARKYQQLRMAAVTADLVIVFGFDRP